MSATSQKPFSHVCHGLTVKQSLSTLQAVSDEEEEEDKEKKELTPTSFVLVARSPL